MNDPSTRALPADAEASPRVSRGPVYAGIHRGVGAVEKVLSTGAQVALFGLMFLTVGNALARYLFNTPLNASLDMTGLYIVPALVWLAVPRLQAENGQIQATFLVDAMGEPWQRVCRLLSGVILLVITTIMLQGAFGQAIANAGLFIPGRIALPVQPSWILVVAGLFGLLLRVLLDLIDLVLPVPRHVESRPVEEGAAQGV